ncbi:MAG: DMT family protein [Bdellovibrionales bacterium]|nr:DMT family protein [Bdellovibrionales bacterium]MBT3524982.1 DMT family protein [Bdellovibrionales bacterium]MBT7670089.1 DMT family protein [Bdellovibrionales bacterium]MBT7766304.1 DMT family protein [Bdellovibrionales bacterium]
MFPLYYSIGLLIISNIFMTFAWYGHLKHLGSKPLWIVILISWGIAFLEYCFQVPGNRIGHQFFTLPQLKVIQEVITMTIFAGFCVLYMKVPITLNFLWASLCLVLAAFFIFRDLPA